MPETYNAASWTASDLLTSTYRAARLPDAGTISYPPSVVLTMADEAIHNWGGHLLASARDGRCVTTTLRSLTNEQADASGQVFRLPPMALAGSHEWVKWVDDEGDCETSLAIIPSGMENIFRGITEQGRPTSYAMFADTLKVYPPPEASGSLKIAYMRRHGQLVVGTDTTTLTYVGNGGPPNTVELVVATNPSSFSVDTWVDVYGSYYPYPLKASYRIASLAAGQVFVYGDYDEVFAELAPGDTVVIYGKTPYISLPLEMKRPLVNQIAQQLTAELGDLELSTGYNNLAKEDSARVADMLSPRSKSDKQKVSNPYSLARGGSRRRFWGGGGRW